MSLSYWSEHYVLESAPLEVFGESGSWCREVQAYKIAFVALAVSVLSFVGCAHQTMRGTVAAKLDEHNGEVCLGEKEVKAGDIITLFKNDCSHRAPKLIPGLGILPIRPKDWLTPIPVCHKAEIGKGRIVRTINEHYSVMRAEPGVMFQEGTVVEVER